MTDAFDVNFEYDSGEGVIGDGTIIVRIDGGNPPYNYKWSEQSLPWTTDRFREAEEGIPYTVEITDSNGVVVKKKAMIEASSFEESVNATFKPIVGFMESILFWDPLSAVGMPYVIKDEWGKPVMHPNGDIKTQGVPLVVIWLVLGAVFFTFRMGFISIRGFNHAFELVRGGVR